MDFNLNEGKVLLSGILYLICGIILLKHGVKSARARYVSVAIAVVSTLLILDFNSKL